jgi:3-hexulose-6-phosphate synthase
MRLQLSCDFIDIDQAVGLAADLALYIDIIEMGTPFILRNGIDVARIFKERFPQKTILADMKIMDGGYDEARMAFKVGVDIVTVLAVSSPNTIRNTIACARDFGKEVMADMIEVKDIGRAAALLHGMGADYICIHTAVDNQKYDNPLADLRVVKQNLPDARIAVAGGIKLENVDAVISERPDIIIVGRGLIKAQNPKEIAKALKEKMERNIKDGR